MSLHLSKYVWHPVNDVFFQLALLPPCLTLALQVYFALKSFSLLI